MGLEGERRSWEVDVEGEVGIREKGGLSICCWQWQCFHVIAISVVKLQMNRLK
jgi:hypothetical protein